MSPLRFVTPAAAIAGGLLLSPWAVSTLAMPGAARSAGVQDPGVTNGVTKGVTKTAAVMPTSMGAVGAGNVAAVEDVPWAAPSTTPPIPADWRPTLTGLQKRLTALRADRDAGRITPEEYEASVSLARERVIDAAAEEEDSPGGPESWRKQIAADVVRRKE